MKSTISKDFEFSASHRLEGLPDEHQCSRLHGHNYILRVIITGEVRSPGFVVDYGELKWVKGWIDGTFDHRHLNDLLDFNPTAENMSQFFAEGIYGRLVDEMGYDNIDSISVSLSETPKTWATSIFPQAV